MKQKYELNIPLRNALNYMQDSIIYSVKFLFLLPFFLLVVACGDSGSVGATTSNNDSGIPTSGGAAGGTYTPTIHVSWDPSVTYMTGTALTLSEVQRYTSRYATQSGDYSSSIVINGPSTTSYAISKFSPGKNIFSVSAIMADGLEGVYSNEVARTL